MTNFSGWLGRAALLSGSAYLVSALAATAMVTVGLPTAVALIAPPAFALRFGRTADTKAQRLAAVGLLTAIGLSALFPSAPLAAISALAVLAGGLLTSKSGIKLQRSENPAPLDSGDCPHQHYDGARAPSSYPNCRLLDGAVFTDVRQLWKSRWSAVSALPMDAPIAPFGGVPWSIKEIAEGGIFVGNSGSGKTLNLLGIVEALAPFIQTAVYDHKRTLYSALVGAMPGGEADVALLNPTDPRAVAWHVGQDIDSWLSALSFAAALAEIAQEREDYWLREARGLLAALIMSHRAVRRDDWTLLTLIQSAHPTYARELLKRSPQGRMVLETTLASQSRVGDRPGDVLATTYSLLSNLLPYARAAEELYRAGRRFSIRDWAQGGTVEKVLIFANHPVYEGAFAPMNRAICQYVSAQLLGVEGRFETPRALVAIDELQAAKGLPVDELLTNGREKGVSVWLATQNLSGLMASLESKEAADSILGGVRSQAFLLTSDVATAERASELAGTQTFVRTLRSESASFNDTRSAGDGGSSRSVGSTHGWNTNPSVVTEKLLQPHVLRMLPPPGPENGVVGLFVRDGKIWFPRLDWKWTVAQLPPRAPIPDEIPVAVDRLDFTPWTREDLAAYLGSNDDDGFSSDPEGEE